MTVLKKLRIILKGEGLLPTIQKYFQAITFPIKSFFVIAQLFKGHIQLTLNQVATESTSLDEKDHQEAIIIQDEIIHIPNIYDSLSIKMWDNIVEDNSLIRLCDVHNKCNDHELLEIFSLENQAEFTNNLKQYVFKNILHNHYIPPYTDETAAIHLSKSCACSVYLTVRNIVDISFRPILQDIISLVSTSLINKQLFGKYRNMQYMFHLIHFNYNPQFQHIIMKILKDETNEFLYEQNIDIPHYTLPELSSQLLKPALQQEPCSYKAFQVGFLSHVHSKNYGFSLESLLSGAYVGFRNKRSDTKIISINKETVFPLFKKGNKISSSSQESQVFYLNSNYICWLCIRYFELKKTDTLSFNKIVPVEDISETITSNTISDSAFRPGNHAPFVISIVYEGYMPSISLGFKFIGKEMEKECLTTIAEPMTLARF
ncbi:hypothetical protein EDC94DRAFT_163419 [Helicostylum pulchrum]|nr:hypothetical protein EDC94DRAFT_163419 [Helicostylum pulchrum]